MIRLAAIPLAALAALGGCDAPDAPTAETGEARAEAPAAPQESFIEGDGTMTTHPNGLTVVAPEGYVAQQTENGFRMTNLLSRAARSVEITLEPTEGIAMPAGSERGGVPYVETPSPGAVGSGGQEYDLLAVREMGERSLVLRAHDQAEYGGPDFDFAWAVLDGASVAE